MFGGILPDSPAIFCKVQLGCGKGCETVWCQELTSALMDVVSTDCLSNSSSFSHSSIWFQLGTMWLAIFLYGCREPAFQSLSPAETLKEFART